MGRCRPMWIARSQQAAVLHCTVDNAGCWLVQRACGTLSCACTSPWLSACALSGDCRTCCQQRPTMTRYSKAHVHLLLVPHTEVRKVVPIVSSCNESVLDSCSCVMGSQAATIAWEAALRYAWLACSHTNCHVSLTCAAHWSLSSSITSKFCSVYGSS